jgi:hypothetical protein
MVRLVFRPYAKIRRSICTSESRRAFTRVSSGFTLPRHRSPSFGYQLLRSHSVLDAPFTTPDGWARALVNLFFDRFRPNSLSFRRNRVSFTLGTRRLATSDAPKNSATCVRVRLLGPCFKTGREASLSTRPSFEYDKNSACGAIEEYHG